VLIVISAIVPQQDISSGQVVDWRRSLGSGYTVIERLGLDRIYYTPTFFIVLGLLGINLTVGNVKRFRAVYRVEKTLLRLRHLGSILFHLSLLLTMTGIVLHYLFKYEGVFSLTEGQIVLDGSDSYFREFKGPMYRDTYDKFTLTLDSIGHTANETDPLGSRAGVTLMEPGGHSIVSEVRTNRPLEIGDYEFHFGSTVGYSPELLLLDSADQTVFRSFVRVARRQQDGRDVHYDFVMLPGRGLKVEMEVIPGGSLWDSVQYALTVRQADSVLLDTTLAAQDTAAFTGYKISIPRLRRWCYIGAIKNPYLNLIFAGFWLSLTGLTLSLTARVSKRRN